jgi:hypothetical protein
VGHPEAALRPERGRLSAGRNGILTDSRNGPCQEARSGSLGLALGVPHRGAVEGQLTQGPEAERSGVEEHSQRTAPDALERWLAHEQVFQGQGEALPQAQSATERPAADALAWSCSGGCLGGTPSEVAIALERWVGAVQLGRSSRGRVVRLQFSGGEFAGGAALLELDSQGRLNVSLEVPLAADAAAQGIRKRLLDRGLPLAEFSVQAAD